MDTEKIRKIIDDGENSWTEFKRCGNGIDSDVYESVCAFSNHFGGIILCGVLDDVYIPTTVYVTPLFSTV